MQTIKTDICVIGGGSGGLSVAAGAAQMGASVVLCEGNKMGGDCLNYGCVPSKALIEASRIIHHTREAHKFGIDIPETHVDFAKVNAHIHQVINSIKPHDSVERFESLGVKVIKAYASFLDSKTVIAGAYRICAKYFVIATGSRARIFPIEGLDKVDYLTNETIFDLKEKPEHLVVIGGGPIGAELAEAYALLGSKVTIIEAAESILGRADPECKKVVLNAFESLGIQIVTSAKILRFSQSSTEKTIEYQQNDKVHSLSCSHLLIATGRTPNIEKLALDKAGITHTKMGITVDQRLRTNKKHIYAIGDLASPYQFTHTSGFHASLVIQNILFKLPAKVDYRSFPWVIYTTPEIAQTGMDLTEAQKQGARILTLSYADNDRAQANLATEGLIKIAVGKKGVILGACIVGESAGELISQWTIAIKNKLKIKQMASFIAPYPTLSEMNKRIAGSYFTSMLYSAKTRHIVRFLMRWF